MNTVLSNSAMWLLIVAFISPLVLQFITKVSADSRVQAFIAFVYSLVAAGVTTYFAGDLNGVRSLVTAALIVFVATIAFYKGFWKPAGVTPSTTTIDRGNV